MNMKKKLYKSDDKILAGICAGIAEYLDIDQTVVRLVTVFIFLFSGFFPIGILYLIMYFVIPEENGVKYSTHHKSTKHEDKVVHTEHASDNETKSDN